jgi:predicted metal-binding protein
MNTIIINPKTDIVFDDKVREMCITCKRYGKKATCPPHIEETSHYKRLLLSYKYGIIYYDTYKVIVGEQESSRRSSISLHKVILSEKKRIFNEGHYFIFGLGAGSCKLCKKCVFPCAYPEKALIPMEATGIDVVETMRRKGVIIKFPVIDHFYRIGGIFYD